MGDAEADNLMEDFFESNDALCDREMGWRFIVSRRTTEDTDNRKGLWRHDKWIMLLEKSSFFSLG